MTDTEEPFCTECNGPYGGWLEQYGGHWDTCPNRTKVAGPSRPGWHTYFMLIAETVAIRSDCVRRQVGAVIVDQDHRIISTGYNGAPAGQAGCNTGACPRGLLSNEEKQKHPNYDYGPGRCISIHAEANALLQARASVKGATLYVTKAPCPGCTKLLVAAGIEDIHVL